MRKIKLKLFFVILVLMLVAIVCVSCTGEKEQFKLIDDKYVYNESEFAKEIARPKENNVRFVESGNLLFDNIVYPVEIDDLSFTEDGGVQRFDRYKVELKNTALFFAEVLNKMVGDNISVVSSNEHSSGASIILSVDEALADQTLGQGYKLKIAQDKIIIESDTMQGVSNGVYSFLEDSLGCMFVSTDYDYIPQFRDINLAGGEAVDTPDIKWRYVYGYEAERHQKDNIDKDYLDWNSKIRLNGAGCDDWYNWCHTSFVYIKPEKYFAEHPEYFSLYNGKRCYEQGPVSGQLCYTNEDVYNIISSQVLQEMAENPDMHIWDVSQMDTWINRGEGCQCKNCKAIDDAEGTPMGSILAFINKLACEVKDKFPNNYISTLSYNYSVKPPKYMKPADNVIIKLCLMPGDCASSLANPTSSINKKDKEIVEEWGKIAKNLLIWDYNVNFHNYLMPHPALAYVQENHKFYVNNNTYGIFHQMAHTKGGIDAELSSYVYAKSMWNSAMDCSKLIAKYMQVYYGKSAGVMTEYYNTMYNDVLSSGKKMYIYDTPTTVSTKYFSHKKVRNYLNMLNEANRMAEDETIKDRIDKVKVGQLYLRARTFGINIKERTDALNELKQICDKQGIIEYHEGGTYELETFYKQTKANINVSIWIIVGSVLVVVLLISVIICVILLVRKHKMQNN